MEKNHLIQLTNELYRLTLLFPKKEPLRYKMRELADAILADSLRIIYPVSPASKFGAGSNGANQYQYTNNKCSSPGVEQNLILKDLEILDGFFEVVKSQNWVPVVEILRIQEQYDRIRAELKKTFKRQPEIIPEEKIADYIGQTSVKIAGVRSLQTREGLLERQEKILEFLKEKGKAQVWEIQKIFPEVSKRTLRRDFGHLLKQGKIERLGERNETFYKLVEAEKRG